MLEGNVTPFEEAPCPCAVTGVSLDTAVVSWAFSDPTAGALSVAGGVVIARGSGRVVVVAAEGATTVRTVGR